jgi:hypothetical protein
MVIATHMYVIFCKKTIEIYQSDVFIVSFYVQLETVKILKSLYTYVKTRMEVC